MRIEGSKGRVLTGGSSEAAGHHGVSKVRGGRGRSAKVGRRVIMKGGRTASSMCCFTAGAARGIVTSTC